MRSSTIAAAFLLWASFPSLLNASPPAFTPPKSREDIRTQILAADAVLFDLGFNQCDLASLDRIMRDDVTMIHDQAGVDEGKTAFLKRVRENICNGGSSKPLRKLLAHTVQIWPLYDDGRLYGAIQEGQHEFYLNEAGKELRLTNRARFTSLWWLEADGWKLKTALSYDHRNPTENNPMDADVLVGGFDRDDDIAYMMAAHRVPAMSVAVIDGGVVTQVRSFGKSADGRPIPQDAIYNAASLAKPVTALVALKLADQGLLNLDAPLPEQVFDTDLKDSPYSRVLTPRHILTHRSGLPNWGYLTKSGRLAFEFRPGEKVQYSGAGFELLRKTVELVGGRALEELARRYVFEPAGMTDTSYVYPAGKATRIATRYEADGKIVPTKVHQTANGAANLMTTAGDYGRFVAYVIGGAGLKDDLARALISPAYPKHPGVNFTLGWSITDGLPGGGAAIIHTGSDPGVSAIAIGLAQQRRGLVILSNSNNAIPVWQAVISEQLGRDGDYLVEESRR